ncbi:hypothetical protein CAPTEDRAFT_224674 [Capitella teleta]|uniref:Rab-like protein 3 n=1 Tax=Capitella teleta TaxID=283909 RepID=R7U424_CAPTE|nr:hypothetical protein CAPTEDRAFT_224674 [Capitella teleta]|eukprot:ELT98421.1 hypothetical protein CAPTEDRAFT_224674 [Capitella teleta]
MAADIDKVRVLVVGDSGVGKTSLVHLVCHNEPIRNPNWTIGSSAEVKLHEYRAGTPAQKTFFVELWDVGGWSAHQNSRSIFYTPTHGIILVHDSTNRKSQQNLRKWLAEVLNKDSNDKNEEFDYDPEQYAGASTLPILVIGTKIDLAQSVREASNFRSSPIADECGADEIQVDCTQVKHISPGSNNAIKLSRFFDKVIERKFYSREGREFTSPLQSPFGGYQDRKRSTITKSFHAD